MIGRQVCDRAAITWEIDELQAASNAFLQHRYPHNSLWNNGIGTEGAEAVAEALKHNCTLTTLLCDDEIIMWLKMPTGCVNGLLLLWGSWRLESVRWVGPVFNGADWLKGRPSVTPSLITSSSYNFFLLYLPRHLRQPE